MAARGRVFLRLPGGGQFVARTDLTGHGNVLAGEEFLARELWHHADRLRPGGRVLRVRVLAVERVSRGYHVLDVAVLEDLTPPPHTQRDLFRGEG